MEALFIGQTYIDVTFLADEIPTGDDKAVARDYAISFGGNAVTAAFAASRVLDPLVLPTVALTVVAGLVLAAPLWRPGPLALEPTANTLLAVLYVGWLLGYGILLHHTSPRGDELILFADLPGVQLSDIDVSVENRTLTLSGQRKETGESREGNVYRSERPAGSFTRTFALPATIDVARIGAELKNGVLRVVLPKAEAARPRRIEIRQG